MILSYSNIQQSKILDKFDESNYVGLLGIKEMKE